MIKTIDFRRDHVAWGAVLRHGRSLFDAAQLRYDTDHAAALSQIVIGEIDDPVTQGIVDPCIDGYETFTMRDGRFVFGRSVLPRGPIAIPIGNRYALKCIVGELQNPLDLQPNGGVVGRVI